MRGYRNSYFSFFAPWPWPVTSGSNFHFVDAIWGEGGWCETFCEEPGRYTMRGYRRPCFLFYSWPSPTTYGSNFILVTLVMINAANLRSFASKSTGKRRNERIPELHFPFSVFLHIDLGQRLLGQILFWVTRVTVNTVDLRLSARESVGKRKNEKVFKLRFSIFAPFHWSRTLSQIFFRETLATFKRGWFEFFREQIGQ